MSLFLEPNTLISTLNLDVDIDNENDDEDNNNNNNNNFNNNNNWVLRNVFWIAFLFIWDQGLSHFLKSFTVTKEYLPIHNKHTHSGISWARNGKTLTPYNIFIPVSCFKINVPIRVYIKDSTEHFIHLGVSIKVKDS